MRRLPEIGRKAGGELPRLADFHIWGEAAEVALGLTVGTFAEAYAANREAATQTALESSPVVANLLKLLNKQKTFEGTASELLTALAKWNSETTKPPAGWPKTNRVLSQIIRRVAPIFVRWESKWNTTRAVVATRRKRFCGFAALATLATLNRLRSQVRRVARNARVAS